MLLFSVAARRAGAMAQSLPPPLSRLGGFGRRGKLSGIERGALKRRRRRAGLRAQAPLAYAGRARDMLLRFRPFAMRSRAAAALASGEAAAQGQCKPIVDFGAGPFLILRRSRARGMRSWADSAREERYCFYVPPQS